MQATLSNKQEARGSRASSMVALGKERLKANDPGNAKAMFLGAIDIDPECCEAFRELGFMVCGEGRYETAASLGRRAIACDPNDGLSYVNLGNTLWRQLKHHEALPYLVQGVELLPEHFGAQHNLGLCYYSLGRPLLAIKHIAKSLELKPENLNCRHDLGLAYLKSGNMAEGLKYTEARWHGLLTKSAVWECGLPYWEGEDLNQSTILIHREQGHGDTIQFIRYVKEIKRRWPLCYVIFASASPLIRLLEGQCGIDEVIDVDKPGDIVRAAIKADYHCPLISVLRVIGATFGDTEVEPYLRAEWTSPHSVRRASFKVGLVWAASPGYERSRQRSIPVGDLTDLATVPGVRLYSLQVGDFSKDLWSTGADHIITDAVSNVKDFLDTAHVMKSMDLIVSVDSGPVHLAGAIGCRTIMMNPITPCWRWCQGTAAWYGCVDYVDQTDPNNWDYPIEQVKEIIQDEMAS